MFNRKRKQLFNPDNTRSRSNHVNTHPQLKDTTGSSNSAFKDKPASGVIVPPGLYNCVQLALAARKEWETKRDKPSELKLKEHESLVKNLAYMHKHVTQLLPLTWKYNAVTANTLVPSDEPLDTTIISLHDEHQEEEDEAGVCKDGRYRYLVSGSRYNYLPHPSVVRPNIYGVPLKEDETESWLQFKKLDDEGNLTPIPGCKPWERKFPVNIEHPFVSVIGSFAVNGFNESFQMFVDEGKHNHLSDPAFRECTFVKLGYYVFDMTIEAVEDGLCGIYKAVVRCTLDYGQKTLMKFSFTGNKGVVGASTSKSLKGKKVGGASKSRSSEGLYLPADSGMVPWSIYNRGGYNYINPSQRVL